MKMEEILDPLQHQMIQYLPVSEFITLCQTSKTFSQFCNNEETWRYFIGRDFGIEYQGENPKRFYFQREAEDLYVLSRLNRIKMIPDETSFWMLMDLVGYKLEQKVPNTSFIIDSVDDMATLRLFGILCTLPSVHLEAYDKIYSDILINLDQVSNRDKARIVISQGKVFYDKVMQYPILLDTIQEDRRNLGIRAMIAGISARFPYAIQLCKRASKMQTDDPVLRNL